MSTFKLTADPILVDLGDRGRATVVADVPFVICAPDQLGSRAAPVALACADHPHVIEGDRWGRVVLWAMNPAREGFIQVAPK